MAVSCDNGVNDELVAKTMEMSMGTISPIDTVPAEILSHIFLHCLPEVKVDPDPSKAPLLLCQISGYWRKLALSTPRLWCSILLTRFRTTASRDRSQVFWLQTWLARSRACPLSLYLAGSRYESNDIPSTSVDTIVECSRQWRELEIVDLDLTPLLALRNVPGDAVPLLESFAITHWRHEMRDKCYPHLHHFTFLQSGPRLQAIKLSGDFSLSHFILPWTQITSLCLDMRNRDDILTYDCMHLLSQCLSITKLVVAVRSPEPENQGSYVGPPIFLSSLTSLDIDASWHTAVLLSRVVAPRLLYLQIFFFMPIWSHAAFLSFIQQSALLKELSLTGPDVSDDQFIDYLKDLPSLARLDVCSGPVITDKTIQLLSLSNSRPCLIPNLEHLRIHVTQPFSDKAFVDMILSRWDSCRDTFDGETATHSLDQPRVARLKSVVMRRSWSDIDAESTSVFRRLAREGLKIWLVGWDSTMVDREE